MTSKAYVFTKHRLRTKIIFNCVARLSISYFNRFFKYYKGFYMFWQRGVCLFDWKLPKQKRDNRKGCRPSRILTASVNIPTTCALKASFQIYGRGMRTYFLGFACENYVLTDWKVRQNKREITARAADHLGFWRAASIFPHSAPGKQACRSTSGKCEPIFLASPAKTTFSRTGKSAKTKER